MAFWLARKRQGQESDWLQRFDPRYWTVNFPRPSMGSVIATGADSLRVDCHFLHKDALVGLAWESEDERDHPLLRYATDRNYSRTVLSFRWRSENVLPLDAVNGPTLTIEGRDAAGATRSWYVRLWNYASGTPTDAKVVLPFSALLSGWDETAQADGAVFPSDIDRMFISLAPPDYDPQSHDELADRSFGWAELSEIRCEGSRSMLAIGDVMVPPHGVGMATAYDDCYNLTPQRIIHNSRALGYRGRLIHYVGMSHFYLLFASVEEGRPVVDVEGALCPPAERWHKAFFETCAAAGFQPIASLSFELLGEACPNEWMQRTHDGEAALTGWEPPSALLSTTHDGSLAWLEGVAANFVKLMQDAGLPVEFQVGEPWNWVTRDGKPCLYESSTSALLPAHSPITDMRGSLDASQLAALDAAGELLAAATRRVADRVRSAAEGEAEVLLLAFTPTICDPEMPELYRANLPEGWAYPEFDRLQIEDYDWLTQGAEALRRKAYAAADQRLSYPLDRQDYMAGFVLSPDDAEAFWRRIDQGLDEAITRGVSRLFVWAYPQIMRDGYTRLPRNEDDTMQPFDDVAFPLALGLDTAVSPEFSTSVTVTSSGHERRSSMWSDARLRFDVGPGIRSEGDLGELIAFFRARRGPARGFRVTDPFDHSSNRMTGLPTMLDQPIGVGDGLKAGFPLTKAYGEGADRQIRAITRPRPESVRVSVDGVAVSEWTLEDGGQIVLAEAPAEGAVVRAGFLFDVPVRFVEDRLEISGVNFAAGEAPSVPLIEIREAI